jgi:hypothetical protein
MMVHNREKLKWRVTIRCLKTFTLPILFRIREETHEPGAYAGFDFLVSELIRKEPQLKKVIARMLEESKVV